MNIRIENSITVITADEGKVFKRISDGQIFSEEVWLGKTYYLGGKRLETPLQEFPEHFEEIDKPEELFIENAEYDEAGE